MARLEMMKQKDPSEWTKEEKILIKYIKEYQP